MQKPKTERKTKWVGEWTDRQLNGCYLSGETDEWTNKWVEGWMDGQMDG